MTKQPHHITTDKILASETLEKLGNKTPEGETTIGEIIEEFHENGILLAMAFFALPMSIPMPFLPGITTILGTPIVFLSVQLMLGLKTIYLPQKVKNYSLKNSTLTKICEKIVPIVKKIESLMQPRVNFVNSKIFEKMMGIISFIAALAIVTPLPLTNMVPALGITVTTLGMLGRDGLIAVLGLMISLIGCAIAFSVVYGLWVSLKYTMLTIFS